MADTLHDQWLEAPSAAIAVTALVVQQISSVYGFATGAPDAALLASNAVYGVDVAAVAGPLTLIGTPTGLVRILE